MKARVRKDHGVFGALRHLEVMDALKAVMVGVVGKGMRED